MGKKTKSPFFLYIRSFSINKLDKTIQLSNRQRNDDTKENSKMSNIDTNLRL
jgi:hypothetical protein